LALSASDCHNTTRSSTTLQSRIIKQTTTCRGTLTVSAVLIVRMYPPPGGEPSRWLLKISKGKTLPRIIKVIGLQVHSRQVLSAFKSLAHKSHWTGAQISCSYHMSNPFIKILWFQHKNLFSRVTNITRLLLGPIG
jgi:hypothetical protein